MGVNSGEGQVGAAFGSRFEGRFEDGAWVFGVLYHHDGRIEPGVWKDGNGLSR
jgi:hypothetical protein